MKKQFTLMLALTALSLSAAAEPIGITDTFDNGNLDNPDWEIIQEPSEGTLEVTNETARDGEYSLLTEGGVQEEEPFDTMIQNNEANINLNFGHQYSTHINNDIFALESILTLLPHENDPDNLQNAIQIKTSVGSTDLGDDDPRLHIRTYNEDGETLTDETQIVSEDQRNTWLDITTEKTSDETIEVTFDNPETDFNTTLGGQYSGQDNFNSITIRSEGVTSDLACATRCAGPSSTYFDDILYQSEGLFLTSEQTQGVEDQTDSPSYSLNDQQPVTINTTTTETNIDTAYLKTNETGQTEQHLQYTDTIDSADGQTEITFKWTNANNVLTQKPVEYQAVIETEDGETFETEKSQIKIDMTPEIGETSLNTTDTGNIIEAETQIFHPIGLGRITSVQTTMTPPDSSSQTKTMRQGDEIDHDTLQGRNYLVEHTNIDEHGEYTLEINVEDDQGNTATQEHTIEIDEDTVTITDTTLSPTHIGQASIIESINLNTFEENIYAQIAGGLLFLSTLVLIAAVIGGAGTEENDFTEHQEFAY